MRVQAIIWTLAGLYYIVLGLLYLAVSGEAAGSTMLIIGSGFGGLVAGWLWHWQRTQPVALEDLVDGDPAIGEQVVGAYPTASIRPLGIAVGMVGMLLGIAVGLWMTVAAVAILGSQLALLVRDADR